MPPIGVRLSLNTEMQKFLPEKNVTPSPGKYPRMTADSAQVSAASMTWTNAEPDTAVDAVERIFRPGFKYSKAEVLLVNLLSEG